MQAHDLDREQEFFAGEIRSARFVTDWPLPLETATPAGQRTRWFHWVPLFFWRTRAWVGASRFWFGYFYRLFSNFGRSAVLPLLWWALIVLIATAFYLGEHPGVASDRALLRQQGHGWASSWISSTYHAAWASPEP